MLLNLNLRLAWIVYKKLNEVVPIRTGTGTERSQPKYSLKNLHCKVYKVTI